MQNLQEITLLNSRAHTFNSMEKDDEIKGSGNHLSFGDYGYSSRLGRRWNIDPVDKPFESLYSVFGNSPILNRDETGRDWYKNNKTGKYEWFESTEASISLRDGKNNIITYSHVSNQINEKILEDIGALQEIRLLKTFAPGYTKYQHPSRFAPLGKMYLTGLNGLFHPNPQEKGDRRTNSSTIFKANSSVNTSNVVKIIMGGFVSGTGPENWFFDEHHEVSKSLNGIGILSDAVNKFKEINKGVSPDDYNAYSGHHSQTVESAMTNMIKQVSKGSYSGTLEDLIGGAYITIQPIRQLEDGYTEIFIEIYNVTSVGSGDIQNSQSFTNPQSDSAQPYTNVSQTFQLRLKVKMDE